MASTGTFTFVKSTNPHPTLHDLSGDWEPMGYVETGWLNSPDTATAPGDRCFADVSFPMTRTYAIRDFDMSPLMPMIFAYGARGPRKTRGLTGRRYRQERRRWARLKRQARREGWDR